ncbi:MAG: glycosyl hydrolase 2 galactose-binding domain-containing protein [Oscillospiraceae bacterium]
MFIQSLNGTWQLYKLSDSAADISLTHPGEVVSSYMKAGFNIPVNVPGSVYTAYLDAGIIEDPYKGENQYEAQRISEDDFCFVTSFPADDSIKSSERIYLHFDGIDTAAEIFFNGISVGTCCNMHRTYEFDVTDLISSDELQQLAVRFISPIRYVTEKNSELPLWGVSSTMAGYPHMRKAHYMFGWDWGPVLPDMGIWRDVSLIGVKGGRIESVYHRQRHTEQGVYVTVEGHLEDVSSDKLSASVTITDPEGRSVTEAAVISGGNFSAEFCIDSPYLWYPRGYGVQPLYNISVTLQNNGDVIDEKSLDIGLRTVEVCRTPDNDGTDGEEFAFAVNGIKIFAMGANYIPEDQLICRRSREKTEKLLTDCLAANYNMIRVWGGGVYPDDWFYDFCDRNGLLVWQDFMFACSVYNADRPFCENVKHEIIDNVKRIRNHPSLAIWCGNNEIESAWQYWGLPDQPEMKKGYLRMFEVLIPKILGFYDPQTFYWPSSPSSGGSFRDSGAKNKGDIHYWEVWHSCKPFTEYNKYLFRFCSEYGFESIPSMKTIRSFAEDKDMNLMSPVMEAHQKCEAGNEKLLYYIAQMIHYPYTFEGLVYASQLVQADAIRLNVEHMRRNRGICMGSLYWQVNDSNPVISWSSIDYFCRWKALHYYAKRFYAPVLLSVDLSNDDYVIFNVSNEKMKTVHGLVNWKVRRNTGEVINEGEFPVNVDPLSAKNCAMLLRSEILPADESANHKSLRSLCLEYSLTEKGAIISSGDCLFVQPKSFEFLDPELSFSVSELGGKFKIEISSKAFAKGVCLEMKNHDAVFSDNWFDLYGNSSFVLVNKSSLPADFTAKQLAEDLTVTSYYTEIIR